MTDDEVEKRIEALRIEKEEALARTSVAEEKLQKLNKRIQEVQKQIQKTQKQKNIKNETDLTREDLSAAELMAILKKKTPKNLKSDCFGLHIF